MDVFFIVIRCVILVAAAVAAGWGVPYVFNRIPAKWLCDYDEEPDKEMWGARIRKHPWSWIFTFVFLGSAFGTWDMGPTYQTAALPALWLLLLTALADQKYRIIPDQFVVALAVTAIGFIPFQPDFLSPLYGALIGGGSLLLVGVIGRWIYRKDAMGFGDVKLMAAIGLFSGTKGIVIILILTIFSAGIIMGAGLVSGRLKRTDEQPLGPYIAASAAAFILFRPWFLLFADWHMATL